MTKKELITGIRNLQSLRAGGEPDPVWLRSTRERLLSEVRAEAAATSFRRETLRERLAVARILFPHRMYKYAAKPLMVSSIIMGMVFGGWVTTVSASYGTLPGDPLYGVKLATEKAQVTLASGPEAKTKLHVEFVGRRVDEVAKIVENPMTEKAKRVGQAVQQLKEDISTVQSGLDELRSSSPETAVEVAKLIDRKAEEFHTALVQSAENLPVEAQGDVQDAKDLVADASMRAVALIVETRAAGTGVSDEDAKGRVGDKISSLEEKVAKAAGQAQAAGSGSASSTPTAVTDQAMVVLDQAKTLLAQDDIDGALSKVIEGLQLAKTAEKATTEAVVALGSGSSSSTPAILPAGAPSSTPATLPPSGTVTSTPTPLPVTTGSSTPR